MSVNSDNLQSIFKTISLNPFPKIIDNFELISFTQDDDEIIGNFTHNTHQEYGDAILFQKVSKELVDFIKDTSPLKLSDNETLKIKILIYKLYTKMVIYSEFVCLNSNNPMYNDLNKNQKKILDIINRLVTKIHNICFELRSKKKYPKSKLIVLANNSYLLFSKIIELVNINIEDEIEKLKI